jgi:hypothetical protein
MAPIRPGGYDPCHVWSRPYDPFGSARMAALFCPSLPFVLVKAILCIANGLRSIDALSCSRIRILSPWYSDIYSLVYASGIFCGFYQYICCTLDDAPAEEGSRNPHEQMTNLAGFKHEKVSEMRFFSYPTNNGNPEQ